MGQAMFQRYIEGRVREALSDTPVILITGPRRAGKTTLAKGLKISSLNYLTLDDQTIMESAKTDPAGFIRGLDCAIIDEIQRVPELLLAIKKSVDDDYRPGRFLLTGSANVMMLPKVADSLAGRMETIHMLPLAQAEIMAGRGEFLNTLFNANFAPAKNMIVADDLIEKIVQGGFPEVLSRKTERRRQDWIHAYLNSVLTRDLKDIADIEKLTELPKFVRLLSEYSAQLANYSAVGSEININYKTSQRYIGLLEQVFLISTLQPWYTNAIKRIIKTPKIHFLDSGILTASRGLGLEKLKKDRGIFGAVLESFVFSEISKLMSWSDMRIKPYHFRNHQGHEVDIVLERNDGLIAGVEVKASATVVAKDFSGLHTLADVCKHKFACGIVLYDGDTIVPFGDKLYAIPISNLWA